MNSGWNSGGEFPMPQGGDFEIGNWEVHTPQRPIPVRSRATPIDQIESLQGRTNYPVFTGLPHGQGYMQELPHCNGGSVQNLNFRAPAEEIQSYLRYDVDLARTNQLINRIAGQSTPIFDMDRNDWNSGPIMSLLGLDAYAFDPSVEGASSSGANGVHRPWSSNYQLISSSGGDFTTNDLIGSQMNAIVSAVDFPPRLKMLNFLRYFVRTCFFINQLKPKKIASSGLSSILPTVEFPLAMHPWCQHIQLSFFFCFMLCYLTICKQELGDNENFEVVYAMSLQT